MEEDEETGYTPVMQRPASFSLRGALWLLAVFTLCSHLGGGGATSHVDGTRSLPDRVFVLALNASGDLFSVASVPGVQNETYDFLGEPPFGLGLDENNGMVTVLNDDWHKEELNITLRFAITTPQGTG